MASTQAELFARSFQSQVARNPGAACLTPPILRDRGLVEAVNQPCPSDPVASHGQVAQRLVVNRLQAPRPLYKVGEWREQSALAPALGLRPEQAHDTRLGETLDALFPQHQAIWQAVLLKAVQRYHLPLQGLQYDSTSTYFEGLYTESEWVQFGYSRDHRPDTKQLELGVTVTGQGLPRAFRVWVGNTADRTTPRQNMEAVPALLPATDGKEATILHDRALATPETLVWYDQHAQNFMRPMSADEALHAVLDAVPQEERLGQPLAYRSVHTNPTARRPIVAFGASIR